MFENSLQYSYLCKSTKSQLTSRDITEELSSEKNELKEKLVKLSENLESVRREVDSLSAQTSELTKGKIRKYFIYNFM